MGSQMTIPVPVSLLPPACARFLRMALLGLATALAAPARAQAPAPAPPSFSAVLLDLPAASFGSFVGSRVWGISDDLLVGEVRSDAGLPRAVAWNRAGMATLLNTALSFEASALAVSGTRIAGYESAPSSSSETNAVHWATPAQALPGIIGTSGGTTQARALAGAFVAGSSDAGAFIYDTTAVGTLTSHGGPGAVAHGVSIGGVAVGQSADFRPAVFGNGPDLTIPALGTFTGSAYAILGNHVVGSYDDPDDFTQKAFITGLLPGDTLHTLGNGVAFALNASGWIVGADFDAGVASFYQLGGAALDLNNLVSGLDGFTLTQARGIDADGSIVAFGIKGDVERAFLLTVTTPVPEPSAALLALSGLAVLGLRRRRLAAAARGR